MDLLDQQQLAAFRAHIYQQGDQLYRDLPWRHTRDPYAVLLSEVMLQQTQVPRVLDRWQRWLDQLPTLQALDAVPMSRVLEMWQGMGYNRRAVALKRMAAACMQQHGGELPQELDQLLALPGVGPATAAGVRAFAFGLPGVYLETNVRTVFLHELFPDAEGVSDKQLVPLVRQACDPDDPRRWYYALLDYGAHLKKTLPNPSRRSAHHVRQSAFEGSHRQKRAEVLRLLIDAAADGRSMTIDEVFDELSGVESRAGRDAPDPAEVAQVLHELVADGMASGSDEQGFVVAEQ